MHKWIAYLKESKYYDEPMDGNPFDIGQTVKMGKKTGEVVDVDYSREDKAHNNTPIKVNWTQDGDYDIDTTSWEDYNDLTEAVDFHNDQGYPGRKDKAQHNDFQGKKMPNIRQLRSMATEPGQDAEDVHQAMHNTPETSQGHAQQYKPLSPDTGLHAWDAAEEA